jgi:AP-1 complex subunit beta-1
MTVGKDVSMLFPDVVNCMNTRAFPLPPPLCPPVRSSRTTTIPSHRNSPSPLSAPPRISAANIELKKLVYLYLINYSKSNPDLAILAVNTFVNDAKDPNPLIRALAIRTMGCIRVDRIVEYLCDPLRRCLKDEDPYVKKTAAVCVAKLYDMNPELAEDQGFLEHLRELVSDANPTVVANAVAALSEISESSGKQLFKITSAILQKLLAALNECAEWGQVFLLDALAKYKPVDAREAETIIERVTPRLQHANAAVVLSAIKVIMQHLELVSNPETVRTISRKMAPPLVTLLSAEPEIQYVALRNINIIVQKRPQILSHEIKVFFCKYNDPIYVKMEKLEIMNKLASERNVEQVLLEFKEYACEVDVDFVRKSVRAIGRCAIKLERAAERCINVLLELIQTGVNYVVQEAICVIKDIFRKYPNRYESILATLCENLDTLDEPEAKASMIWIIGEYAERIDNAVELLETFLESFHDETASVQLQLLTATVKLFLKRPSNTKEMMEQVLAMATEDSDNPDLRDRGYIYWRLLSTDPEAAKAVVLSEKPVIADDTYLLEPSLLEMLVTNISTLASVYHKPPDAFVVRTRVEGGGGADADEDAGGGGGGGGGEEGGAAAGAGAGESKDGGGGGGGGGVDLLNLGSSGGSGSAGGAGPNLADVFGGGAPARLVYAPLVDEAKGAGIAIGGVFVRKAGAVTLELEFSNRGSAAPPHNFAIQFNKNTFGLSPVNPAFQVQGGPVAAGGTGRASVPISFSADKSAPTPTLIIQAALKSMDTQAVSYFFIPLPLPIVLAEDGAIDKKLFVTQWRELGESREKFAMVSNLFSRNVDSVQERFTQNNVFFIARRAVPVESQVHDVVYFSLKTVSGQVVLIELTFSPSIPDCKVCVKTEIPLLSEYTMAGISALLSAA